mgnify:CR=1 FL=1
MEFIDRSNQYLNRKFEWVKDTFKRTVNQFFLAIVIPAILAIVITFIQWEFIWHKSLIKDHYFKYEFLPQVLLILIINLVFVVVHLLKKGIPAEAVPNVLPTPIIIGRKGGKKIPVQGTNVYCI